MIFKNEKGHTILLPLMALLMFLTASILHMVEENWKEKERKSAPTTYQWFEQVDAEIRMTKKQIDRTEWLVKITKEEKREKDVWDLERRLKNLEEDYNQLVEEYNKRSEKFDWSKYERNEEEIKKEVLEKLVKEESSKYPPKNYQSISR